MVSVLFIYFFFDPRWKCTQTVFSQYGFGGLFFPFYYYVPKEKEGRKKINGMKGKG